MTISTSSVLLFLVFFLSTVVRSEPAGPNFSDEEVFELVYEACSLPHHYYCPKTPYLSKIDGKPLFNHEKIQQSKLFNETKWSGELDRNTFNKFREEFCCSKGECLADCNLSKMVEKQVVARFSELADAIFALDIPEINKYQKDWERYTNGETGDVAEIEELYDYLAKNEENIRTALREREEEKGNKII